MIRHRMLQYTVSETDHQAFQRQANALAPKEKATATKKRENRVMGEMGLNDQGQSNYSNDAFLCVHIINI